MIASFREILAWIVALAQAPLLVAWLPLAIYLVFLTLAALVARLGERRKRSLLGEPSTRFAVLVPAHDEEPVITDCVKSLMALDYPRELYRVVVIADNCQDTTEALAAATGAEVYVRHDPTLRGKGYALDWALRRLLSEDRGWTGAVVVFDADTVADPHFLSSMDAKLATGSRALQGQYSLLNPFDNWRTALLYSALLLHNRLRPLARQAKGWSTLLKGNGMCFSREVVERFGWNAYSLAEDIEYTTTLMEAGIRVEAVPGALLYAEAPVTGRQAGSQRMRWEGGRFALMRRDGVRLVRSALRHRSAAELDWAMDLITPPTGILIGVPLLMLAGNAASALLLGGSPVIIWWSWLAMLAASCLYVLGGLLICGADKRAYLWLLATPVFLLWKLKIYATMLAGRGPRGWVRTERGAAP